MADRLESVTTSWPDLAISLYDKLTDRGAEIMYEFDDLEVSVPSCACASPDYAKWKVNGTLKIRTKDESHGRTH